MRSYWLDKDPLEFAAEVRARQRNIVFPDTVINSRPVWVLLWRGSAHPTLVQRIGAWLLGVMYVGIGVTVFELARQEGSRLQGALALGLILLGLRIFRSGFPRRESSSGDGASNSLGL